MGNFFYSQDNIRVEYSFKIPSTSYIYNSYLEVSPEASYFEINNKAITEDQTNTTYDDKGNPFITSLKKGEVNEFVYKDFKKDSIVTLTHGFLTDEHVYINEKNPTFDWKIENENKEILGYQCTKAVTTFRGRSYTAWSVTDIKTSDGPWKFSGLPGLILEIYDKDGEVKIEANKLVLNAKDNNVVLPKYDKKYKIYNWESYTKSINTTIANLKKQMQTIASENDATVDFKAKFNGIDYIYKD